jgi:MoxR-like ATPase
MSSEQAKTLENLNAIRQAITKEINKTIVGQQEVIENFLTAIFAGGHCLLEGVPGLAKTMLVSTLAEATDMKFSRIQFTPDLMPSDITGTEILAEVSGESKRQFQFLKGPVFANIILADEINRTPPKTQSSLLEAMQEYQVTAGNNTFEIAKPFLVMATQNPIEQEGTYPLPEAQQDRFMMKLKVKYPSREEERGILQRFTLGETIIESVEQVIGGKEILAIRKEISGIYVDGYIVDYVLDIVLKTRENSNYISCGASPRASINLIKAAQGVAYLEGRDYVIPDDVKSIVYDVLRHRIILTYEAEAEDLTSEMLIKEILESIQLS